MKRISLVLIFILILVISSFAEQGIIFLERDGSESLFTEEAKNLVRPNTELVVYIHYPGSAPLSYTGKAIANLEDALIINVGERVFFVRKQFIEKLVILDTASGEELAMTGLR